MYKNILVPLAPDHGTVKDKSLDVARKLMCPGGKITVLTVVETVPAYLTHYLEAGREEANRRQIAQELAAEFAATPEIAVAAVLGHPAQTILDIAERDGHDCIVIASHKPGLQDLFLGSTAARVVRHAQCGVHVLR